MGADTRFVDALENRIKLSIHTFAPARVVRYYESTKEADLEILFMSADKNGLLSKYPMIVKAPVLGMRFKTKSSYSASVSGLIDSLGGSVNGSNANIFPKEEIEYIPFLKPGDVVFVAFAERAIDNLQKQPFDPQFRRTHDLRDAVVLGVWDI